MLLAESKHVFRYRNVQLCDEFEKYQNYAGVFVLEFNYNSKGDVRLCIDDQESIYARLTEWKEGVTKDGQSFLAAEFLYREKGRERLNFCIEKREGFLFLVLTSLSR